MSKIKVLFVDDDILLGQTIVLGLEQQGFEVVYQTTLASLAGVIEETKPDIIVLDVMVGRRNSIDTLSELKTVVEKIPIIIVSSLTDSATYVRALNKGAITFLRKPFKLIELIANINRYVAHNNLEDIAFGEYLLCSSDRILYHKNQPLRKLTKKEYKLLAVLAEHLENTVTKELILDSVWAGDLASKHSLSNYIIRLRKYLSNNSDIEIITISNVGYMLSVIS